jgi:hypothetical protein
MNVHSASPSRDVAPKLACVLALIAGSTGWSERAAAAEPSAAAPAVSPGSPSNGASQQGLEWGWLVLGSSLVAASASMSYGLSLDCADADRPCQRRASLAIWGSVGIVSLGSVVAIVLLQPHAASPQAQGAALDLQLDLELGAASSLAGPELPSGALLRLAGPLHW